jgi:hypothetical protein
VERARESQGSAYLVRAVSGTVFSTDFTKSVVDANGQVSEEE